LPMSRASPASSDKRQVTMRDGGAERALLRFARSGSVWIHCRSPVHVGELVDAMAWSTVSQPETPSSFPTNPLRSSKVIAAINPPKLSSGLYLACIYSDRAILTVVAGIEKHERARRSASPVTLRQLNPVA
jgi:hypothetical protein